MRKLIAVVVAIVASAGSAAAADASTWHASPAGGVLSAGTGGGLTFTSSANPTVPLSCLGTTTWTVTVAGHGLGTANGPTLPTAWNGAAAVGPRVGSCGIVLGSPWRCNKDVSGGVDASLNATSTTASAPGSGVTTGQITGIDCTLSFSGQVCGSLTGKVGYTYDNASKLMTLPTGSQSLVYAETPYGANCPLRTGVITIKNGSGTSAVFTVAGGPLAIWAS